MMFAIVSLVIVIISSFRVDVIPIQVYLMIADLKILDVLLKVVDYQTPHSWSGCFQTKKNAVGQRQKLSESVSKCIFLTLKCIFVVQREYFQSLAAVPYWRASERMSRRLASKASLNAGAEVTGEDRRAEQGKSMSEGRGL